jgi:hypothetical protein
MQAAMQVLIMSRFSDGLHPKTPTPFNHTCLSSEWVEDPNLSAKVPRETFERLAKTKDTVPWTWVRHYLLM